MSEREISKGPATRLRVVPPPPQEPAAEATELAARRRARRIALALMIASSLLTVGLIAAVWGLLHAL